MNRNTLHLRGKQLEFKKTLVARALMVAFGAATLTVGISTTANAQTSATGSIYGQVDVAAGTTITIVNKETGARRNLTPDKGGRYSATSLAIGTYNVQLVVNGKVTKTTENIEVRIGQGSEVDFGAAVQRIEVLALRQKIDVSSMGSTTIFTASDLAKVPVATNVGAVVQLAPNTTRGDARYGDSNAPSFGGASSSENAYYINGFPVTTLLTQVGFSQLPFNSISQAQVLTGGYSAEFGRSTGGVVNIVTKSGTNQWMGGVTYSVEPNSLRSKEKNQLYEVNGTTLDGKYRYYNGLNKETTTALSAYLGGPIIKDKLFLFAAVEDTTRERDYIRTANTSATYAASATSQSTAFQERTVKTPRFLVKLDWNITDAHHLEYTKISDRVTDDRQYFGFNYATLQRTSVQNGGQKYLNWGPISVASQQGAEVDILKYTGNLTEDLTLTALVGQTRTPHEQSPAGYNPILPQVTSSSDNQIPAFAPYGSGNPITGSILVPGAFDKNAGTRLDVEYRLNSQHSLRAGVDQNKITSKAGTSLAGGLRWDYGKTNPAVPLNSTTAATNTVAGNPYAQQGYYVTRVYTSNGSTPTVEQSAWYIEDRYQVTDRVLLSLGLRNEAFNNKNGDGLTYIDLAKQLAPRLGATWDVQGDASFKVFGNLGRYHVPLPTNVAVRGAGSSLYTQENFVYTGVNADGTPSGLTSLGRAYSANNEYGQAKDPRQVAAENMKGNYQDEFALGFEKALSKDMNVGAKFTHRALKVGIDDHCDDRPFLAWAARNGVNTANFAGYNCALFNPGIANTFNIDMNGDGTLEKVALSAADLGMPEINRKYIALDLFAEHPFDGKWWGKMTYTWSRNTGNMEGQLLSDIGQGDVATTQAWDFPEFAVNAQGRLPNDRKHQIKLFGYYQATPEWGFGGNLLLASGRPKNCIGNAPSTTGDFFTNGAITNYSHYNSAYFFCNGVASPRGSAGNLPADIRLDLNFTYKPDYLKGFGVKLDIFNVFDRQSPQAIEERYNTPGGATTVWNRYGTVESYTSPRSMKITASYDYKF